MIFLELSLCSMRDGKSGSCWEPSSRLGLPVDVVRTSGQLKRGRYGKLPPVKNAVANPPEITRFNKLRCDRAMSCFSIIGPRLIKDSITVITRITKQFLIFRSRIPMVLMEIMVALCNGSDTRCETWWGTRLMLCYVA